jgi:hypothetical protein
MMLVGTLDFDMNLNGIIDGEMYQKNSINNQYTLIKGCWNGSRVP